jgi:hypothetical protein
MERTGLKMFVDPVRKITSVVAPGWMIGRKLICSHPEVLGHQKLVHIVLQETSLEAISTENSMLKFTKGEWKDFQFSMTDGALKHHIWQSSQAGRMMPK